MITEQMAQLEQISYQEAPEIKIEDQRSGYCRACHAIRQHTFYAEQYDKKRIRVFDIYTCNTCGDSKAFNLTEEWKRRISGGPQVIKVYSTGMREDEDDTPTNR